MTAVSHNAIDTHRYMEPFIPCEYISITWATDLYHYNMESWITKKLFVYLTFLIKSLQQGSKS